MTLKKDEALKTIRDDFEALSNLVLKQLDIIENVITEGENMISDDTLKRIRKNEMEVDKKEVKLSDQVINTISLYHPVASELRQLMAIYRIVISLERISDLVMNISGYITKVISPEVFGQFQEVLQDMIIQGNRMVKESLVSFINEDRDLAIWTLKNKPDIEEISNKLIKKVAKKKSDESDKKFLLSVIRIKEMMANIERIIDHATNIAEASLYYLEGKDVRHRKISE
jgi:phosphate transport system protein